MTKHQENERTPARPMPGGMNVTEKPSNFMGTFLKILRYGKKYLPIIALSVVCAAVGTILTLVGPDKLSEMTDLISAGLAGSIDLDAVLSIGLVLVVLYLAGAALTCAQNVMMARVTQLVSQNLRSNISHKINRLPMYVRYFTQPLSQISQAVQSLQSAAAAGERVFDFLEAEEMAEESAKLSIENKFSGAVTFDHVRFGYNKGQTILHDFSAEVKPGQKIAIVGPTGAGKTTIVNLLMRFYEPESGDIRLDGLSTSQMRREDVHDQFYAELYNSQFMQVSEQAS